MEPAGRIEPQPWMTAPETRAVIDALAAEGASPRFVGGCVRDALLGRAVTDVDIATPDVPSRVIELLERARIRTVPTGLKHGTVTAVVDHRHFQITTLRRDVRTFGRHAEVEFSDSWKEDAARRDLTINALSCAPDGTLYDPFRGLSDLKAGRIRFVGDPGKRIAEDHLRLLRFFRFYAYYGRPPPDEAALAACQKWKGSLAKLSGERVREEMLKILAAREPLSVLAMMEEAGVLSEALPEMRGLQLVAELASVEQEQGAASGAAGADGLRRLAAAIRDGDAGAKALALAERWRLSKVQGERLSRIAEPAIAIRPRDGARAQRRALYRLGAPLVRDLVLVAWAERRLKRGRSDEDDARFRAMLAEAARWRPVRLPVRGSDVKALGVAPGKEVGRLLAELESWWERGDFKATRKEALAKLKRLVSQTAGHKASPQ